MVEPVIHFGGQETADKERCVRGCNAHTDMAMGQKSSQKQIILSALPNHGLLEVARQGKTSSEALTSEHAPPNNTEFESSCMIDILSISI